MSFAKVFHKKIRAVQVRCGLNLLLQQMGRTLAVAGVLAGLVVLVQRLLAVAILSPVVLWVFWGVAGGVVLLLWLIGLPNRMQVSLLLDERLGLRERFSTTLALANSDDPFARAARAESLAAVQRVKLQGHFPIGLSRSWYYGAGTWLIAIAMVFLLPQKDLLGLMNKKQQAGAADQASRAGQGRGQADDGRGQGGRGEARRPGPDGGIEEAPGPGAGRAARANQTRGHQDPGRSGRQAQADAGQCPD